MHRIWRILRTHRQDVDEIKDPRKWLSTVCKKTGGKDLKRQMLRHTQGFRLTLRGVHLEAVQVSSEHPTASLMGRNQHLAPRDLQVAFDALAQQGANPEPSVPDSGIKMVTEAELSGYKRG